MVPWNVGVADRWSSAHRAEMRFRGRMIGLADGLALKGKRKGRIKIVFFKPLVFATSSQRWYLASVHPLCMFPHIFMFLKSGCVLASISKEISRKAGCNKVAITYKYVFELGLGQKAFAGQIVKSPRLFTLIAQQMVHFSMFYLTYLHTYYTIRQS